jgi:hypothetical protein
MFPAVMRSGPYRFYFVSMICTNRRMSISTGCLFSQVLAKSFALGIQSWIPGEGVEEAGGTHHRKPRKILDRKFMINYISIYVELS